MTGTSDNKAKTGKQTGLTISDELKKKHPELIALIIGSESMNDEERQYWVNILPIMTPEQIQNLKEILMNEKTQLEAIDKKYSSEIAQIGQQQLLTKATEERRNRRSILQEEEDKNQEEESKKEAELLRQIEESS